MAADPGGAAWQDFGQRVDLTARIREILRDYSEGTSVFKELVQNADDAKATCVRFCLDHRQHPAGQLLSPNLAEFQGPALYVYNDGLFNEKDFASISKIGNSAKREQVGKTGRFGVGFNACYHLTDLPSFVSGSDLAIFDPHCKFLPNVSSTNPGKRINFVAHPEALAAAGDMAAPYAMWGCDLRRPFPGTFFRFPLRTAAQAASSTISKQSYTPATVSALLHEFAAELELVLLFLKSVVHISIEEVFPEGAATSAGNNPSSHSEAAWGQCPASGVQRQLVAACGLVTPVSEEVARQRALFLVAAMVPPEEEVAGTYTLTLTSWGPAGPPANRAYLVSQARGTGPLAELASQLTTSLQAPVVPWAAVAAPLHSAVAAQGDGQRFQGHAFCFLPLPVQLQLPVHLNAFFELSSNRRDVWAPGAGLAGAGAARAQWNLDLLRHVAAPAYLALLQYAVHELIPKEELYRWWPAQELNQPWQVLVEAVYPLLAAAPLLWTQAGGGSWLTAGQALFPDTTWAGGAEAHTDLVEALLLLQLPLVQLPPAVLGLLKRYGGVPLRHVTPSAARGALGRHAADCHRLVDRTSQLAPLLAYVLSDCDCTFSATLQRLIGVLPLPAADGGLGLLAARQLERLPPPQQRPGPETFVVTEPLERLLVGQCESLLLDTALCGEQVTQQMQMLAAQEGSSLRLLSPAALVELFLPRLLPLHWRGQPLVEWEQPTAVETTGGALAPNATSAVASEASPLSWEWLQGLWTWCGRHPQALADLAAAPYPLLPTRGGRLAQLAPGSRSAVVAPDPAWPQGLAEVLEACGCLLLDVERFELPLQGLVGTYVHAGSGPGVAAALWVALGGSPSAMATPAAAARQHPASGAAGQPELAQLMASAAAAVGVARGLLRDAAATVTGAAGEPGSSGTTTSHSNASSTTPGVVVSVLQLQAVLGLAAQHRELLRGFLLQQQWFIAKEGPPGQHVLQLLLQQLPVFQTARSAAASARAGAESESRAADAEYVSLIPTKQLAPPGVEPGALGPTFVGGLTASEEAVLRQHMQVAAPSAAAVLRGHVLPNLAALPPGVQEAAVLGMLRMLPSLQQQDPGFIQYAAQVRFVPDAGGALHAPHELYDPRVPELLALLDPATAFPAAAFCGAEGAGGGGGAAGGVLPQLQQLGLRSSADLGTLVLAARFVQHTAEVDGDMDLALARGKALLSYLDSEAERLVGATTAVGAAAAAAAASDAQRQRKAAASQGARRPGLGFLSAVSDMLAGVAGEAAAVAAPPSADQVRQQRQQQQQALSQAWAELQRVRWCPALVEAPAACLPWPAERTAVAAGGVSCSLVAPCAARPASDAWLVSGVLELVDGEVRSPALLQGLGWSTRPAGALLGTQLAALGAKYPAVLLNGDASSDKSNSGPQLTVLAPDLAQQLARGVPALYSALAALPPDEMAAAAGVLRGGNSVWVGHGFAPASKVAFKGALDLSPYLFVLPMPLSPFRQLLAALGAAEAFSGAQFAGLLRELAAMAGSRPLQPGQLSIALAATEQLANMLGASGGGATAGSQAGAMRGGGTSSSSAMQAAAQEVGELMLPDEEGVLRPSAQLMFNDAPFVAAEAAGSAMLHLIHPRVSAPVAAALGIASRRRLLLVAAADSMSLSLVTAGGVVEAWGQSEDLCSRLKHILQDYPEGPSVLLELVQNADDAGATRVSFTLDTTTYPANSLLGPAMAPWQGPALLAYNDAVFSPGDFQAIARIGQAGKMGQPAAIGRFGLGFNAVYHLTDLPSFVSGSHLVMFDPHAAYLPGATPSQPGLRLRFTQGHLADQFPDAFAPYRQYGCTMRDTFPGTLFRLPLRGEATAASSDIKPSPTSLEEAQQLLAALQEQLPAAMLFLKSVQEVEVQVLDRNTSDAPQLLFRATATPLDGPDSLQAPIVRYVSAGGGGSGQQQLDALYQRLSAEASGRGSLPLSAGRVRLCLQLGAAGGAASSKDGHQEDWLVCNQLCKGAALKQAVEAWRSSHTKLLPWVGVAALLPEQVQGFQASSGAAGCHAGRAFCFLPLPIYTGLAVHLNGFFELSSNRRDVWAPSTDMSGSGAARAQWNLRLMEDGVAPAYTQLLQLAAEHLGPTPDLWRLFPSGARVGAPWSGVVVRVYASLAATTLLHTPAAGGRWLAPSSALLPSPELLLEQQDKEHSSSQPPAAACQYNLLGRLLIAAGLPLVQGFSAEQLDCLKQHTPGVSVVTPAAARQLFQQLAASNESSATGDSGQAGSSGSSSGSSQQEPFVPWLAPLVDVAASISQQKDSACTTQQHVLELLLQYCLSDMGLSGAGESTTTVHTPQQQQAAVLQQVDGLPLLCLRSGGIGTLRTDSGTRSPQYWVTSSDQEVALLAACPGRVVATPQNDQLHKKLLALATMGACNLMRVNAASIAQHLLPLLLPAAWQHQLVVDWPASRTMVGGACAAGSAGSAHLVPSAPADVGETLPPGHVPVMASSVGQAAADDAAAPSGAGIGPSPAFVAQLWQVLSSCSKEDSASLSQWPLVPLQGGRLHAPVQPARLLRPGAWGESASVALSRAGVQLLDTHLIAFTCPALDACVQPATAGGLLLALGAVAAAGGPSAPSGGPGVPLGQLLDGWAPVERRQLRSYLLQSQWFMGAAASPLGAEQIQLLKQLPIYEVHAATAVDKVLQSGKPPTTPAAATTADDLGHDPQQLQNLLSGHFVALSGTGTKRQQQQQQQQQQAVLAPSGMPAALLGSRYLRCDSDVEEEVLEQHLGVARPPLTSFLLEHVALAADQLDATALTGAAALLLGRLDTEPALLDILGQLPIIPTRHVLPGGRHQLAAPRRLMDPAQPVLAALFGPDRFPAPPFDGSGQQSTLLRQLARCGLQQQVTLEVLVEAAEDLAKEAASSSSSGGEAVPSSEALQKLLQRAACLLDALSSWADSHEQEAAAAAEEAARASATPRGSTPTSGQRRSLVCWQQLRSISWCPVVQVPPHPSMPWPEPSSLRPGLLFPPRMVRRAADGWLCSAAMRLLQGTASPALCGALGWDAPLKAPVLVGQLVELGGRQLITPGTPADAPRSTADLEAAGSVVEEACAALYNALGATLVSGSSNEQGQLLSTTLPDAAVVWVGAGFVQGSLVRSVRAQRQPSEQEQQQQEVAGADVQEDSLEAAAQAAIAAGLLWELPATLLSRLTPVGLQILAAAGVDDGFSCSSFVQALAALADMAPPGVPLPEQQAQLAALLAEAAGVLASEAGAPALVMLPDADGRMAPASQLFVADAPWLLEEGVAETGWRFVSPSVSITAAVALGALSMRAQQDVQAQVATTVPVISQEVALLGASLVGAVPAQQSSPPAGPRSGPVAPQPAVQQQAADVEQQQVVLQLLMDLLEVADVAAAAAAGSSTGSSLAGWSSQFRVLLDERQHPRQRLLHPGLATTQGPALLVQLPGPPRSIGDIALLLSWGKAVAAAGRSGSPARGMPGGAVSGAPLGGWQLGASRVGYGAGCAGCWAITDVVQVLTGHHLVMWDAAGSYMGAGGGTRGRPGHAAAGQPVAQQFDVQDNRLVERFPDQFCPWPATSTGMSGSSNTLIRLPLRQAAGRGAAPNGLPLPSPSLTSVRCALAAFAQAAAASLPLLGALGEVVVDVWQPGGSSATPVSWLSTTAPSRPGTLLGHKPSTQRSTDPAGTTVRHASPFGRLAHVPQLVKKGLKSLGSHLDGGGSSSGENSPRAAGQHRRRSTEGGGQQVVEVTVHVAQDAAALAALATGQPLQAVTARSQAVQPQLDEAAAVDEVVLEVTAPMVESARPQQPPAPLTPSTSTWLVSYARSDIQSSGSRAAHNAREVWTWWEAPLGVVAVQLNSSGSNTCLLPAPGLGTVVMQPCMTDAHSTAGSAGHLSGQRFAIAGNLVCLSGSCTAAEAAAGPGRCLLTNQSSAAESEPGSVSNMGNTVVPPPAALAHNSAVLAASVSAWVQLLQYLVQQQRGLVASPGFYTTVLPDLQAAAAAGAVDAAAAFKQMYTAAASSPFWLLHSGECVYLQQGVFLQPGGAPALPDCTAPAAAGADATRARDTHTSTGSAALLGDSARAFLQQHLTLFQVPWSATQQLEAAGVSHLRCASPALLRPLLRRLTAAAQRDAAQAGIATGGPLLPAVGPMADCSPEAALQLLTYCTSDLPDHAGVEGPSPAAEASPRQQLDPAALLPGFFAAAGEGLRQMETFMAGVLAQPQPTEAAAATGQAEPPPPSSPAPPSGLTRGQVAELQGLPVPLMDGRLAMLGASRAGGSRLCVVPSSCQPHPWQLFEAGSYLHEGVAAALGEGRLQAPWVREALGLQLFSLQHIALGLQGKFGASWHNSSSTAGSAQVMWDASAPEPVWLRQLWKLALAVVGASPAWGATPGDDPWVPLEAWHLLPLSSGALLRMAARSSVLVALQAPEAAAGADAGHLADLDAAEWLQRQPQPWSWVLPGCAAVGVPLLHPAWQQQLGHLAGPQPAVRRPPFLGPLVSKLQSAVAAGLLVLPRVGHSSAGDRPVTNWQWGQPEFAGRLFELLADHPPRDLDGQQLTLVRCLPIFAPLYPKDVAAVVESTAEGGLVEDVQRQQQLLDMAQNGLLRMAVDTQQVHVVPADVASTLSAALQLLPGSVKATLLAHQPGWGELLSVLGLEPVTPGEAVRTLLLPHLAGMDTALRAATLALLLQHWSRWKGDPALVAALADLAWVPGSLGQQAALDMGDGGGHASGQEQQPGMYKPSQLYDPTRPLFTGVVQALLTATSTAPAAPGGAPPSDAVGALPRLPAFPAAPFNNEAWLALLRDVGLISNVTPEVFTALVELLKRWVQQLVAAAPAGRHTPLQQRLLQLLPPNVIDITQLPEQSRDAVEQVAGVLLTHLRRHHAGLGAPPAWWNALGDVPWVPANFGPPGVEGQLRVLTSYKAAASVQDWPLAWASCPLLEPEQQLPAVLSMPLGFRSPPAFARVLAHVQQVADAGGAHLLRTARSSLSPNLAAATLALLQHLHKEGLSPGQAEALRSASPWLPLPGAGAGRLVTPAALFFKLPGALGLAGGLAPYAWEVPAAWSSVAPLLEQLGAKAAPSPTHLLIALQRFGTQLGPRPLNPNELAATLRLLGHLAATTPSPAAPAQGPAGSIPDGPAQPWPPGAGAMLLVPSADGRLVPASQVASVGSATAARWLGRCDPAALSLVHPQLPDDVVRWAGVAPLEELVVEVLEEAAEAHSNTNGSSGSSQEARLLQQQQLQELEGWTRPQLVAWLTSTELATAVAGIAAAAAPSGGASRLRQLTPWGVQRALAAAVGGRGGGSGLVMVPSLSTRLVLVANGRDITANPSARQVYDFWDTRHGAVYLARPPPGLRLSGLLAALVSRLVGAPGVLPLHPLLEPGAPQHAGALGGLLSASCGGAGLWGAAADVGQVGAPLSPADQQLVVLMPLRPFTGGELVAVTCRPPEDPSAAAAAAADARATGRQPAAPNQEQGRWQLVYGRVVTDCAPPPGAAAYLVPVEVAAGEVTQVLSSQVFAFASRTDHSEDATLDDGQSGSLAATGAPQPSVGAAPDSAAPAATSSSSGTPAPATDTPYGGTVAPQQVVGAVSDMLAAAGLPLDLERQELLQQALSAQQALAAARGELAAAASRAGELSSQLEAAQRAWTCRICFTRPVDTAFSGCGHVFCSACTSAVRNKCPVCRSVSNPVRLFK